MHDIALTAARRSLPALAAATFLISGCRDQSSEDRAMAADSALARDLAMAQRQLPPQPEFNDVPLGGPSPARPESDAPRPRPEPPRAAPPRPRPAPRRESPPAPVARTPRQPAPEPETVAEAPAPAARPGRGAGIIGAGSSIGMTTDGQVCTHSALAGDKFTATVSSAVVGSNGAVIPAGSTVVLEVASVERGDPVESSQIHFRVRAIDVDGETRQADGSIATLGAMQPVRVAGGSGRTTVIGGAIAGAVLGRVIGNSTTGAVIGAATGAAAGTAAARRSQATAACLPPGTALRFTLSRELVVRGEGRL